MSREESLSDRVNLLDTRQHRDGRESVFEEQILISSILLLLCVLVSKISHRVGIPVLLCFLGIGMLAGSDGPGGIYFDNAALAQSIGIVALTLILFSGGLDTQWQAVRPVVWSALSLATIGVLLTTVLVGLAAIFLLHVSLLEGMLLGAIISSTDAAAVFSVLQTSKIRLRERLTSLLELESGCNDPMAVFLTLDLTILLTTPHASVASLVLLFFKEMGIGALCGLLIGKGASLLIPRLHLEVEGLYPVLTIALALFVYGLTAVLGGSGFLAVYLAGMVLGSTLKEVRALNRFHDGLAWLMQIALFITLGLFVFPSHLPPIIISGLLLAGFLIFVARPVSVLISLVFDRMSIGEKLFVSWMGLRGAVPIVLATFPLLAGFSKASLFFNLIFFIVLTSVLLQGLSLTPVAKLLGVIVPPVE